MTWTTLVEIDWDPNSIWPTVSGFGTGYYSFPGYSSPTQYYSDALLSVSRIAREVDILTSEGRVSGCDLELDNSELEFSKLRAEVSFKNRTVRVKFGDDDDGFASLVTVFTGKIESWEISALTFRVSVKDANFASLGVPINGRLTTADFANLSSAQDPILAQILFGDLGTTATAVAPVPCPLIDTVTFKYLIARHLCNLISNVFSGTTLKATPVDYSILTGQTFGQFTNCHVLDFVADQGSNEITAQVQGHRDDAGNYLTKPADVLELVLTKYLGIATADLDAVSFFDAKVKETNVYVAGIALREAEKTGQEWVDRICASFNLLNYRTRAGKFAVYQFLSSDYSGLVADRTIDENDISDLAVEDNERVASRLRASWQRNYSKDYFEKQKDTEDAIAKSELGNVSVIEDFEQWAIRDIASATSYSEIARLDRRYLMRETHHFAGFSIPPRHFDLELADVVALTHWQGVAKDGRGYRSRLGLVVGLDLDPAPINPSIRARVYIMDHVRPTDIPNLSLWLDASRITGLLDGDGLGTWKDDSGNGLDASQGTPANRPIYKAGLTGLNGKPVVRFTAANSHFMTVPDSTLLEFDANQFTMFAVLRNATGANKTILCKGVGTPTGTDTEYIWQLQDFFLKSAFQAVNWNPDSNPHVLRAKLNGTDFRGHKDGVQIGTSTASGAYATDLTRALHIGKQGTSGTNFFDGDIAELIIYKQSLRSDEIRAVEAYLGAKYAIVVTV